MPPPPPPPPPTSKCFNTISLFNWICNRIYVVACRRFCDTIFLRLHHNSCRVLKIDFDFRWNKKIIPFCHDSATWFTHQQKTIENIEKFNYRLIYTSTHRKSNQNRVEKRFGFVYFFRWRNDHRRLALSRTHTQTQMPKYHVNQRITDEAIAISLSRLASLEHFIYWLETIAVTATRENLERLSVRTWWNECFNIDSHFALAPPLLGNCTMHTDTANVHLHGKWQSSVSNAKYVLLYSDSLAAVGHILGHLFVACLFEYLNICAIATEASSKFNATMLMFAHHVRGVNPWIEREIFIETSPKQYWHWLLFRVGPNCANQIFSNKWQANQLHRFIVENVSHWHRSTSSIKYDIGVARLFLFFRKFTTQKRAFVSLFVFGWNFGRCRQVNYGRIFISIVINKKFCRLFSFHSSCQIVHHLVFGVVSPSFFIITTRAFRSLVECFALQFILSIYTVRRPIGIVRAMPFMLTLTVYIFRVSVSQCTEESSWSLGSSVNGSTMGYWAGPVNGDFVMHKSVKKREKYIPRWWMKGDEGRGYVSSDELFGLFTIKSSSRAWINQYNDPCHYFHYLFV